MRKNNHSICPSKSKDSDEFDKLSDDDDDDDDEQPEGSKVPKSGTSSSGGAQAGLKGSKMVTFKPD